MFLRHWKTRFSLSGAALGVGTTLCGFVLDCARPWSTDSRSALPGLNFRTCRAGVSTLSPFLGLRPKRGACWVTVKLPNPDVDATARAQGAIEGLQNRLGGQFRVRECQLPEATG